MGWSSRPPSSGNAQLCPLLKHNTQVELGQRHWSCLSPKQAMWGTRPSYATFWEQRSRHLLTSSPQWCKAHPSLRGSQAL